jgi:hypothetical protein
MVQFTIGQLISVIALFLAFSQLTKPMIRFRIRAAKINLEFIFSLFVLAIICVFIASLLPSIPVPVLPHLSYSILLEFIAGLLFVVTALILIVAVSKKPVFTRRKSKAYLNACTALIARGNDDDLRELADEISVSVKLIFEECKTYDSFEAHRAKERGKVYQVHESTKIAFTILDLWSDKSFCKNIVCKSPATAIEIFDQLISNQEFERAGYALSQQLINQAFVNRESILMREEDYSGLGFFKPFRNTVFGNWRFIESNYRPLQAWQYYEENIEAWQVEKYCECLEMSFNAYFKAKDYWQYPSALHVGLEHLARIAGYQVAHVRHIDEHDLYRSKEFQVVQKIGNGLEKVVKVIEKEQCNIPEYKFEEKDYDHFNDTSIYGVLAFGIYDYLEKLAMAQKHDEAIRLCVIELWLRVFGVVSSKMSKSQSEIGRRLVVHLRKKVVENLEAEQRWYPAITRLLITLNGICEPKVSDDRIGARFHKEFIDMLKTKYSELAKKDPEFAEHMLPDNVVYDRKSNELRHKRFRQEVDVLKLTSAGPD